MSFQNIPPPPVNSSRIQERRRKIPDFTKWPRFLKVPSAKDLERAVFIHTKIMSKSTEPSQMTYLSEPNNFRTETLELDLFSDTPIQVDVHQLYFCETRNISFVNDTTQLEFSIPRNCTEYLDLQESSVLETKKCPSGRLSIGCL